MERIGERELKNLMKKPIAWFAAVTLVPALVFLTGCATTKKQEQTESLLTMAGFKALKATTPAQEQKLMALTPGTVSKVTRQGNVYYVYPDQSHKTLYVGNPTQYQTYLSVAQDAKELAADQQIAQQTRVEAEMNVREDVLSDWYPGW